VEWFAEECRRVDGDVLQSTGSDRRMLTIKQPVRGRVAQLGLNRLTSAPLPFSPLGLV